MMAPEDRTPQEEPERQAEQYLPEGGRPGKGPVGHPYGGRGDVPEDDVPEDREELPGEWKSSGKTDPPEQRPSGRV